MRLAVIGLGAMGWNHVRVAKELGALSVVADMSAEARARAERLHGVPAVADQAAAFALADAVVIATPTSTHVELALAAIAAGKHVLVEKPLADTRHHAVRIVDAAHEAGVVLAVGHIERHNPVVAYAKKALQGDDVGKLLTMTARRVSSYPGRIRDVGCILDIGIHEMDIARYLAGSEATSVHALAGSSRTDGREDHAVIQLGFANGVAASIETNWLTPMRVRKNTLTCTEGMLELDYMAQSARLSRSQFTDTSDPAKYAPDLEYDAREIVLRRQEPLRNELEDFLGAAQRNRAPLVGGKDGLQALRIAEAALESVRS
ncbi:MAG TPA: Gfo/Idh/MocA family oxidoreductase, partial [Candidatus Thermoplasmatota archaeon]|nr:Gfo/Idh/MocA family oxidoreductase [Candidatus Thermoplasmatota archaeon]